jgi:tetratricopeptide (TPR) repeat protein
VAILSWYKEHHVREPVPPAEEPSAVVAPVQPSEAGAPGGRRMAIGGGALLAVLVMGLALLARHATVDASRLRSRLDALASENGEPPAPVACQEQDPQALAALAEVAPRLSDRMPESSRASEAAAALVALQARALPWRPEGWFLVARASLLAGHPDAAAMSSALECKDFAAAENLAGRMAALSQDWEQSAAHYARAAELAPSFWKPRFNLGLIHLRQQHAEQAVPMLERAAELAPEEGEVALFLGHAYKSRAAAAQAAGHAEEAATDLERAQAAWCRAKEHGAAQAAALCKP